MTEKMEVDSTPTKDKDTKDAKDKNVKPTDLNVITFESKSTKLNCQT